MKKTQKDPWLIGACLYVTSVVSAVVIIALFLSDSVATITAAALHGKPDSPLEEFEHWGLKLIIPVILIYVFAFLFLKYVQYPNIRENGLFGLPNKRDFYGNELLFEIEDDTN